MKIETTIDEEDYLMHLLYNASKSELIKNRRLLMRLIIPVMYLVIGLFFLTIDSIVACIIVFVIGVLWFFLYPLYDRKRYIRHYRNHIRESHGKILRKGVSIELERDCIIMKDSESESKVNTTMVEEVNETPSAFYVKLKGAKTIILSKSKIKEISELRIYLKELAAHLNIKYNLDDQWVWK